MSEDKTPTPRKRGILEDLVMSLWEPGVNRGLLILLHGAFIALLCSLLWMLWLTGGNNTHVWILTVIAVSLYATIVW
jgi:hypothetical protein